MTGAAAAKPLRRSTLVAYGVLLAIAVLWSVVSLPGELVERYFSLACFAGFRAWLRRSVRRCRGR